MYKTFEEKPIQKKTEEKSTHKRTSWPVLVLFPTILLILILGATMGTVIGFKSQLKSFEDRIVLLEESTTLKMDHNENNPDSLQKKMAEERSQKADDSELTDVPKKTAKKHYYAESSRPVKVSKKTAKKHYRTARSGDAPNSISAPL
jgi:hypothetical protein